MEGELLKVQITSHFLGPLSGSHMFKVEIAKILTEAEKLAERA